MNEKYIWELWSKCKHPHPEYGGGDMIWPMEFTELIVKECMDIARQVGNISDPEDFALDRCYEIEQKIQDRFGVKE